MNISPKVYIPLAISLLAALLLFLLTGDKSFLVMIALSLVTGGAGVAAKPAPEVTQLEVQRLSERKRGLRP